MDAHALLSAQGWRGKGHSLHATSDSIGLSKPLLLNRKDNTKGLGQKAHFTSDTWWMNAFDEQLQGLDTSKKGQVTQTVTQGRLNQIEKVSGGKWMLYASFVRGGFLEGTIRSSEEAEASGASTPSSEETSESESEDGNAKNKETKERGETKEERRARKAAKKARKAARDARRQERAAKREKKAAKAGDKGRKESKEERRARRKAKEAKREARKAKKGESG